MCILFKRGPEGEEGKVRGSDKSKHGMAITNSSIRPRFLNWKFRVNGDSVLLSSCHVEVFGQATS